MRAWLAERLRRIADWIDEDSAPRYVGYSFTFERGIGIAFHEDGSVDSEHALG